METATIKIRKNANEIIKIERGEYQGIDLLHARVWYDEGGGEYKPSKKGLSLRPETWRESCHRSTMPSGQKLPATRMNRVASKLTTTGRGRHIICHAPECEGSLCLGLSGSRQNEVVEMLCLDTVAAREGGSAKHWARDHGCSRLPTWV